MDRFTAEFDAVARVQVVDREKQRVSLLETGHLDSVGEEVVWEIGGKTFLFGCNPLSHLIFVSIPIPFTFSLFFFPPLSHKVCRG